MTEHGRTYPSGPPLTDLRGGDAHGNRARVTSVIVVGSGQGYVVYVDDTALQRYNLLTDTFS